MTLWILLVQFVTGGVFYLRTWLANYREHLQIIRQVCRLSTAKMIQLKLVFEHTLLHLFHKGAFFRQWLLRPDCPPFLRFTRDILDKAYGYTPRLPLPDPENALIDIYNWEPYTLSPDVLQLVGTSTIQCFSRVTAAKGFYTIPTEAGIGNSYQDCAGRRHFRETIDNVPLCPTCLYL